MGYLTTHKISKLFRIRGCVHPDDRKTLSASQLIEDLPMPDLMN